MDTSWMHEAADGLFGHLPTESPEAPAWMAEAFAVVFEEMYAK